MPLSPKSSAASRLLGPAVGVWDPCNLLLRPSPPPDIDAEVLLVAHDECGDGAPRMDLIGGRRPDAELTAAKRRQARAGARGPLSSKFSESKLLWVILSKVNSVVDSLNLNSVYFDAHADRPCWAAVYVGVYQRSLPAILLFISNKMVMAKKPMTPSMTSRGSIT